MIFLKTVKVKRINFFLVSIVSIVVIIILLVLYNTSFTGTYTNSQTILGYEDVKGYLEFNDEEVNISFKYPKYCEINYIDSNNIEIKSKELINGEKIEDEYTIINITTNQEVNSGEKMIFNKFLFTLNKLVNPINAVNDETYFMYKLEKINNKNTIVIFGKMQDIEKDITTYYSSYSYINENGNKNRIDVQTSDEESIYTILGTLEY